jgi:hypothetical protein
MEGVYDMRVWRGLALGTLLGLALWGAGAVLLRRLFGDGYP